VAPHLLLVATDRHAAPTLVTRARNFGRWAAMIDEVAGRAREVRMASLRSMGDIARRQRPRDGGSSEPANVFGSKTNAG